jgi:Zn-dependent protease
VSRTLPVGRVLGVPIRIGPSWLVGMPLVGAALFLGSDGAGSTPFRVVVAVAGTLLMFGSVVLHEVGHAVTARRAGIGVRRVVLFLFGGFTELEVEDASPDDDLAVATAGPVVSGALAVVFWAIGLLLPAGEIARVMRMLALVNGGVAVFNLMPGFPLDGGRMVRAMLVLGGVPARRAASVTAWFGIAIGAALVAFGFIGDLAGRPSALLAIPVGVMVAVLAWAGRPPHQKPAPAGTGDAPADLTVDAKET